VFAGLLLWFVGAHSIAAARDLLVGGGSVRDVNYQVALSVCEAINHSYAGRYHCIARPGLGSVFNINAVNHGLLDLGVAQSDSSWQATNGTGDWEKKGAMAKLRSLFSMQTDPVLLVTRADTGIESVADLKGRRVNLGTAGSPERNHAVDVLRALGFDPETDLEPLGLTPADALLALANGSIDALFETAGSPSSALSETAQDTPVRVVPIDSRAIRKFVTNSPHYVDDKVAAGSYPGITQPLATIGVKATVVASADLDEQVAYDVVAAMFANLDRVRAAHPAFAALEPKQMLRGLAAPLHPGAARYYRERGWL
jgi:TRAP transporter TAXI family solute receptor